MSIKPTWKTEIIPLIVILASFGLAWYFYMHSPAVVVSHWNIQGQPNGYMDKFWGSFFFPIMLLAIYLVFLALPFLDPRREKYESFAKIYHLFKTVILLGLFGVGVMAGLYNIGYHINIAKSVSLIVGVLIIVLGNYMGKIKSNWFVGVRTPWTLSSEDVWNKTNRVGGYMMMLFGLCIIISPYLPKVLGLVIFILGALVATLGSFVYSYFLYQKEQRNK